MQSGGIAGLNNVGFLRVDIGGHVGQKCSDRSSEQGKSVQKRVEKKALGNEKEVQKAKYIRVEEAKQMIKQKKLNR